MLRGPNSQGAQAGRTLRIGRPPSPSADGEFIARRAAEIGITTFAELSRRAKITRRSLTNYLRGGGVGAIEAEKLAMTLRCARRDILVVGRDEVQRDLASAGFEMPRLPRHLLRSSPCDVIAGALRAGGSCVLWGEPRIGKTVLAAQVAARLGETFSRGVVWIDCAQHEELSLALDQIAEVLLFWPSGEGAHPAGARRPTHGTFAEVFWARERLLVIDGLRGRLADGALQGLLAKRPTLAPLMLMTDDRLLASHLEHSWDLRAIEVGAVEDHDVLGFLQREQPLCASKREIEALLRALAGRPSLINVAQAQLTAQPFSSISTIVASIDQTGDRLSGLTRDISLGARELLLTLSVFGGAAFGLDWAIAVGGRSEADTRMLLNELHWVITRDGMRLRLADCVHGPSTWDGSDRELSRAVGRLLSKAVAVAGELDALPVHVAAGRVREERDLWWRCLQVAAEQGRSLSKHDLVLAVRDRLVAWPDDRIGRYFELAVEDLEESGRCEDSARLRLSLGRWHILRGANFGRALEEFLKAADVLDMAGHAHEAASAHVEAAVALFATKRPREGTQRLERAFKTLPKDAPKSSQFAADMMVLALSKTRSADDSGWRQGLRKLQVVERLLERMNGPVTELLAVTRTNIAIARAVIDGPSDALAARLRELEGAVPKGDLLRSYLLATAIASGVTIGSSIGDQRAELREMWWGMLDASEEEVEGAVFRLGELIYYLNSVDFSSNGYCIVSRGTAITKVSWRPSAACLAEFGSLLFRVEPFGQVFDKRFLEAAHEFVIRRCGGAQTRLLSELEIALRSRAKQGRRPEKARTERNRGSV